MTRLGTFNPRCSKCFGHEGAAQCIERSHDPGLIHQVGKINFAAPRPLALFAYDHIVRVIEQDLRVQLLGETALHRGFHQSGKDQINLALEELEEIPQSVSATCST